MDFFLPPRVPRSLFRQLCTTTGVLFLGTVVSGLPAFAEDPKPGTTPPAEAEAEAPHVVRPVAPEVPPNPEELRVRPQENGKLRFNFQGQPWPAVMEWLADVSNLSLDWQELPPGFVNLRTEREYTIDEARDLINRQLLDRGFTLLKDGEILSVVPVKKLDPSLVPWITPEELETAQPHDFVRVVFPLETLSAESTATEFKSLLSPNGKLSALKSTNRIEAMDAVVNLRQIQKLLNEEESPAGQERQIREFKLKYTRAQDVQQQLQKLLGLDKAAAAAANADPNAIVQKIEQIMQRGAGTPGSGPARPGTPQVFIVADPRDNSILAHAPAEQMAVITQAVRMIDTPNEKTRSVLRDNIQTQVYPLTAADPDTVVSMLKELGDLEPATRLQSDRKRRAIVAHAAIADHLRIRMLIEKVDGKARTFRVVRLHRVQADYVASAVDLVMGGGDSTKRAPGLPPSVEDEARRFRVVADVEQNRLLLWVNDLEFEEVQGLLTELGETPAAGEGHEPNTRVVELPNQVDSQELLRRVQELWPAKAPNRLEIGPRLKGAPEPAAPAKQSAPGASRANDTPGRPAAVRDSAPRSWWGLVAALWSNPPRVAGQIDEPQPAATAPRAAAGLSRPIDVIRVSQETPARELPPVKSPEAPPVTIDRSPDGRWTISSDDEGAAEQLKKLLGDLVPPTGDFKVFRLKHKNVSAFNIAENLRQIFDPKQKVDKSTPRFFDPNTGKWISNSRETDTSKQTKVNTPKFVVDLDTNSILAIGADPAQLKAIEQVIGMYDVPDTKDPLPKRNTRLIKIQHAQVKQISDSVKEVYRDLLTVNDPPGRPDQPPRPQERYTYAFGSKNGDKGNEIQVRYKGQLAISIDEPSNTMLVSAPDVLLEDVVGTIESLDEAAAVLDQRVRVVKINRQMNVQDFHKRLQRIGTRPQVGKSQGDGSSASR